MVVLVGTVTLESDAGLVLGTVDVGDGFAALLVPARDPRERWSVDVFGAGVQLKNAATGRLLGVPAAEFGAVVTTLSSGTGHTTWTAVPNGDGVALRLAGHDLWIEAEDPLTNPPQFLIAAAGRAGASCGTCWTVRPVDEGP
ncbi:RICIN domain-containing protein [Streptomyces sp. NBC_01283]|uniref:hypothetical protein n=1 Tax=Streptomyces sp. NBC_01283 TaxID=2903812 RepID=UPI00352C1F63|nr:RICIN domain-containing protein [Streptomyces sp. NBC_01283]